ncbi:MAG: hypothetical protein HYS53_02990 [Candidatus Aenigmarchaeota archaeon]|nr:hypothetical protein [Candidatus Aenigmarchaeota archaeon]
MARSSQTVSVPSPEELYGKGAGEWIYDHTLGWVLDHKIASTVVGAAAAGAIAAGVVLSSGGLTRPVVNTVSQPISTAVSQTTGQTGETAVDIYYSQVRASLLQDVPDFANPAYKTALDYTTQRMVDLKTIRDQAKSRGVDYGVTYEQIKQPLAKWVQANIDWDKKGERLVLLKDNPNFVSPKLISENETLDPETMERNGEMAASARLNNQKVPQEKIFAANIDSIIAGHDQIWADIHDPKKMEEYLKLSAAITYVPYENRYMEKHKKAIVEQGTFEDIAHYALVGRAWKYGFENEEITRNEFPLAMILAVGGDARIETNSQIWDISNYKGSAKMRPDRNDRQLAFRKSAKLKEYFASNQQIYGTPLDPDYIEPALPSIETIDALKGYVSPESGTKLLGITSVTIDLGMGMEKYLVGKP